MLELLALFILIQYEMHFFQPESIMKYRGNWGSTIKAYDATCWHTGVITLHWINFSSHNKLKETYFFLRCLSFNLEW